MQGNTLQLSQAVSTIAGVSPGSTDGIGSAARFNAPYGISTDGTSLFVADRNNRTIRKVDIATQAVTTLAGSAGIAGNVDDTGAAARFSSPVALTSDGTNLYVLDGHSIRKVAIATGRVTTIAGDASNSGYTDGTGVAARFSNPSGIATNGTYIFVADAGNRAIRKVVIATAEVTTLAGGVNGSIDGIGTAARFGYLGGVATDGASLFVADSSNNTIRKIVIATAGVSTLAGTAGTFGSTDGTGAGASFGNPTGITTDGTNLFISESANDTIRKLVLSTGEVTTLAGSYRNSGSTDGIGVAAKFYSPSQLVTDGTSVFVADTGNDTVRKVVIATGAVTTFAGTASPGSSDGTGAAAKFRYPNDITTDGSNLFVADTFNYTIRKIVIATGAVSTLAGSAGSHGSTDGTGNAARFGYLKGITTDGTNLYVTDFDNYTIRKIVIATGEVTTLAGSAGTSGSTDGTGSAASFRSPSGITTDGTNLYVTDAGNHAIRKIVITTGVVTTLAGTMGTLGATDGIGAAARFNSPRGITTDGQNIFVADLGNGVIRKVVIATGEVTTLVEIDGDAGFKVAASISVTPAPTVSTAAPTVSTAAPTVSTAAPTASTAAPTASTSPPPSPVNTPTASVTVSTPTTSAAPVTATTPIGLTTDGTNMYITKPYVIRKMVIATGVVTSIAGSGKTGSVDGVGTAASFAAPNGITTDGKSLYVTDNNNNSIRKIN